MPIRASYGYHENKVMNVTLTLGFLPPGRVLCPTFPAATMRFVLSTPCPHAQDGVAFYGFYLRMGEIMPFAANYRSALRGMLTGALAFVAVSAELFGCRL